MLGIYVLYAYSRKGEGDVYIHGIYVYFVIYIYVSH